MLKTIGLLGAILLASVFAAAQPKKSTAALDDVLRMAVEQKRAPFVVAMVATPDGLVYEGAFGADKDAIFAIASMTKPITSVAAMQLVESGKVKLDEPVATYLPELGQVQVLEAGGALRAPKTPVTVRHLLTHTSGFAYEFLDKTVLDAVAQGKVPSMMAGGDGYLKAPLVFDPGERWQYGISTDWLGRLIEKVSGQTLDAYLREHVFQPLGMEDTYFNVPAAKQARLVQRHRRLEDGRLEPLPQPPPVTYFSGGGGLYSTAGDYMRFTRAVMAGGGRGQARILAPASIEQMGRNQLGERRLQRSVSLMPQLVRTVPSLPGRPDTFGLGFALNSAPLEKGRGANTMSWSGVHNTFFWIDRDRKLCAVLLTQVLPFMDEGAQALIDDFDRAVYAWRDAGN
jgi:CubicO group peptidase (beta-lactamase class C family)